MQDLINQLREMPETIAIAETEAAELRRLQQSLKAEMSEREIEIVSSRSAKEWGSNADERKAAQSMELASDPKWYALAGDLSATEIKLSAAEIRVSFVRNTFYALRSIADLAAATIIT